MTDLANNYVNLELINYKFLRPIWRQNVTDGWMSGVKVGDKLVRAWPGFRDKMVYYPATVTDVREDCVKVVFEADVSTSIMCDRLAGISVDGPEFGWLINLDPENVKKRIESEKTLNLS